jgi:hypothetical protein
MEFRNGDAVHSREQELSDRLERGIRSAEIQLARPLTRYEKEDTEKWITLEYAQQTTQQEIDEFMAYRGFEKVNDQTFKKDKYTVSDLRPRNVLKTVNENIFVVDDIINE